MAALILAAALSLTCAVPVADGQEFPSLIEVLPSVERWQPFIEQASRRFDLPQSWITAVMGAESAGRTRLNGRPIRSPAGAMGLMQLMPRTWSSLRRRYALGADPYDPHDNIMAGAAYLRALYDRFGCPGLFGAYNAGPGRYTAHLMTGFPLPAETRAYLAAIAGAAPPVTRSAPAAPDHLFFALRTLPGSLDADRRGVSDLFVAVGRAEATPAD